jgi:hypothetical protein
VLHSVRCPQDEAWWRADEKYTLTVSDCSCSTKQGTCHCTRNAVGLVPEQSKKFLSIECQPLIVTVVEVSPNSHAFLGSEPIRAIKWSLRLIRISTAAGDLSIGLCASEAGEPVCDDRQQEIVNQQKLRGVRQSKHCHPGGPRLSQPPRGVTVTRRVGLQAWPKEREARSRAPPDLKEVIKCHHAVFKRARTNVKWLRSMGGCHRGKCILQAAFLLG